MNVIEQTEVQEPTTAEMLREALETYEDYDRQRADLAEFQKALLENLKGDGIDTKIFRKIVALRKKNPNELEEEAAIMQLYLDALKIEIKGVIA